MALTATASQGFEFVRYIANDEVLWVPGDPGDTYTRGDLVSVGDSEGFVDPHAAGEFAMGTVIETVVCPAAATAGYPKLDKGASRGWGQIADNQTNTLVPIRPFIPVGTPILRCTFASHTDDENITAYTAATPSITVAAIAGDNDHNGALVYVYGGPGVGQWNTIASTVAATNVATLDRIFNTALTTASDVIYLGGAAGDDAGISFFSQVTATDANTINAAAGATDGEFRVYLDARQVKEYLEVLMLPVIPSALNYHA
jgi:hypothetical protein